MVDVASWRSELVENMKEDELIHEKVTLAGSSDDIDISVSDIDSKVKSGGVFEVGSIIYIKNIL